MASTAPDTLAPGSGRTSIRLGTTDALLFLMALIWAVNYSVLKFGTRLVPPLAYNGARIPLAGVLQFAIARAMRLPAIPRQDVVRLLVLGMLGNGVYQVLFIIGMARSRVATTVLVLASGPALAAMLGYVRGTERLSRSAWAGIALQLTGVGSVVLGTAGTRGGADSLVGVVIILAAALSWAWFSVLVQPFTTRISGLDVGAYTMLGGGIVSFLVGIPLLLSTRWTELPGAFYAALGYSTVGAMVIAYLLWYHGVRMLGPTRTSMYGNLQPVIAMAVAWASLGEVPSAWQLAGATCITSGLILARSSAPEPEAP
jgi:drug/metabolite transporter (DMT)-like permease